MFWIRSGLTGLVCAFILSCSVNGNLARDLGREEAYRSDFRGLVVYDLTRGKELLNYNGNKFFIPASTVKLFTFYTAYTVLPDSVPSLEYLFAGDSLFIRGTGDPLVLDSKRNLQPDPVIAFLRSSGNQIFLVDRSIEDDKYGPGWSWEDYGSGYMPERNLIPLYGNRLTATRKDSTIIVPEFLKEAVESHDENGNPWAHSGIVRDADNNRFRLGNLAAEGEVSIPFITSNQLAADLLGEAVGRRVTLVPYLKREGYQTLYSQAYDSLYTRMLVESDNFIAEQLMLQVGMATQGQYKVSSGINFAMDSLYADLPQKPRWVDGSGLSRYNLFTPESLIEVLKRMYNDIPQGELLSHLAKGGVSGTLENHYASSSGEPYVFAKSGTLSNNYCLSGYLKTKKGRLLAFSYMDNHYRNSTSQVKKELENYLRELREGN